MGEDERDFTTISPSAVFLALIRAYTNIPFAKEAAAILAAQDPEMAGAVHNRGLRVLFPWVVHFENRYRTVGKLLRSYASRNFLEISSGYSFRGLDMCRHRDIYFIDTDLPGLVAAKKLLVAKMGPLPLKGTVELSPLNALDEQSFSDIVARFDSGPLTIINEGLLVYLDEREKEQVCKNIAAILRSRGGSWITADIYTRKGEDSRLNIHEAYRKFREQHNIEENKFENEEAAKTFFASCGLAVNRKERLAIDDLSCLDVLPPDEKQSMVKRLTAKGTQQETWELIAR